MKNIKGIRKLILSFVMIVLTFISLVTSTYAWFTMSKTVTVSNISISVVSADNLLAAQSDTQPEDIDYRAHLYLDPILEGLNLKNVSTINLTNWYTTEAADPESYEKDTEVDYEQVTGNDLAEYVLSADDIWLKYVGEDDSKYLYVSDISLTHAVTENETTTYEEVEEDMYKCFRFGVKIGNDFYIYAKGTEATNNYGSNGTTRVQITNWQLVEAENRTDHITIIEKDVPLQISIFMWFEGEDSHCYQNNIDIQKTFIEFKFSIRDVE